MNNDRQHGSDSNLHSPLTCSVCGGTEFKANSVLWPKLIDDWQLSPTEVAYVDRQQGECCTRCGANLRSIALADAVRSAVGTSLALAEFVTSADAANLSVLEVNTAGTLNSFLSKIPKHTFAAYPEVDIHSLPWKDQTFDIVVHSDTLEHVANPAHALVECRRVLKGGGALCFTVPIIVGRMTRGRQGLPKSHHGNPLEGNDDYVVHTEFGADAWTLPVEAGFSNVTIFAVAYPAGLALMARR
ncbi:MAG: class I SAM-dependent methyltransferase [Pseudorhodoplanes sp.]